MSLSIQSLQPLTKALDFLFHPDRRDFNADCRRGRRVLIHAAPERGAHFVQDVIARHYRFDRARHIWRNVFGAGAGRSRWLSHPRIGPTFSRGGVDRMYPFPDSGAIEAAAIPAIS